MNKKLRIAAFVLATAIFVGSSALVLHRLSQYRAEAALSEQARELASESVPLAELPPVEPSPVVAPEPVPEVPAEPEPTPEPVRPLETEAHFLAELDLHALQAINSDVLGWISIPGTAIDYPLLQSVNNSYYLSVAWDGSYSSSGSIFLERRSNPDFTDYNTIIYGHNMRSGSMFAALHQYKDAEFFKAHPNVYITDGTAVRRYEIYAAYEASVTGDTYRLVFENEEEKQRFLALGLEQSVLETELTPDTEDQFLTLSTCTGTGYYETRWVVQAVLTGTFPIGDIRTAETTPALTA